MKGCTELGVTVGTTTHDDKSLLDGAAKGRKRLLLLTTNRD